MLGPFTIASRLTPIHQVSPAVLSRAACASMSTTPTTTTTRDRGDRYGPMEWAQLLARGRTTTSRGYKLGFVTHFFSILEVVEDRTTEVRSIIRSGIGTLLTC